MIPPIEKEIEVAADPARAFDVFTAGIDRWWPKESHSLSAAAGAPAARVHMEPRVGGRIVETGPDGATHVWGEILDWAPGERVRFTWAVAVAPELATEVEVRFAAAGPGRCRVRLVHGGWDAQGDAGAARRDNYNGGWDHVLGQRYVGAVG